jgi:uncharacterized membrane protein YgcG
MYSDLGANIAYNPVYTNAAAMRIISLLPRMPVAPVIRTPIVARTPTPIPVRLPTSVAVKPIVGTIAPKPVTVSPNVLPTFSATGSGAGSMFTASGSGSSFTGGNGTDSSAENAISPAKSPLPLILVGLAVLFAISQK